MRPTRHEICHSTLCTAPNHSDAGVCPASGPAAAAGAGGGCAAPCRRTGGLARRHCHHRQDGSASRSVPHLGQDVSEGEVCKRRATRLLVLCLLSGCQLNRSPDNPERNAQLWRLGLAHLRFSHSPDQFITLSDQVSLSSLVTTSALEPQGPHDGFNVA
jgi:hypothetical protein